MLGSVEDAEDILQGALLRRHSVDVNSIETPAAWLTTVITRLALKQLESARVKRESYIGPWLPAGGVCGERPAAHTFNPR
jgi:RNA polymerase sigma-70 factor (ECF subfamily)